MQRDGGRRSSVVMILRTSKLESALFRAFASRAPAYRSGGPQRDVSCGDLPRADARRRERSVPKLGNVGIAFPSWICSAGDHGKPDELVPIADNGRANDHGRAA